MVLSENAQIYLKAGWAAGVQKPWFRNVPGQGFSLRKDAEALIRGDKKASASTWWTFMCEDVSFVLMSYRTMQTKKMCYRSFQETARKMLLLPDTLTSAILLPF
ncbi:hypothetical protein CDAR_189091 [Caerostris darwini]|uniref:Uncharacterized protein n=1 Tax=Caerostris darwini TaxID=1538125 RepID=A0AAV4SMS8_9ARAC|nr:hypothetical protein CDAR_189091 [Caerostris darwini]